MPLANASRVAHPKGEIEMAGTATGWAGWPVETGDPGELEFVDGEVGLAEVVFRGAGCGVGVMLLDGN